MRANSMGLEDFIFRVVVPEQKEIEINKDGQKKEKTKIAYNRYEKENKTRKKNEPIKHKANNKNNA
jgi:transcription antitermination factor NusG